MRVREQPRGFLILGADGSVQTGRSLVGLPFPEEPGVWLDSVIRDGLRPVPSFEVRAWQISDDRAAAVVMVEPTPLPPCITTDGAIFERVSGRTVPAREPDTLARLYDRGEAARVRAESTALGAMKRFTRPSDDELRPQASGEAMLLVESEGSAGWRSPR